MDKGPAPRRKLRRFPAPQRTRESSAPPSAAATRAWSEPGELPQLNDRTRVVLMAVSPYLVHAYWDLDSKTEADSPGACLRFHDTTSGQPPSSFDIPVNLATKSWYVQLWSPAKRYTVELGLNRADDFVSLARSNAVETPRAWPVAEVQERFARVGETSAAPEPQPVAPVVSAVGRSIPAPTVHVAQPPAPMPPSAPTSHPQVTATAAPPPPAAGPSGPPAPAFQPPVNSAEALRNRLMELYANRSWRARPAGVAAGSEPEPLLPERQLSEFDLTGQAENRFTPGFSSSLLGLGGSKKPAG